MAIQLTEQDREALLIVKGLLEMTDSHFTLKQLCRKSGLNSDKLKKGFKLLFSKPPHQYHLEYKMSVAKRLLQETEMHIDEIGYALGYNDASNFCAGFKKLVGMKPGEWRAVQPE